MILLFVKKRFSYGITLDFQSLLHDYDFVQRNPKSLWDFESLKGHWSQKGVRFFMKTSSPNVPFIGNFRKSNKTRSMQKRGLFEKRGFVCWCHVQPTLKKQHFRVLICRQGCYLTELISLTLTLPNKPKNKVIV